MESKLNLAGVVEESVTDGPGIRYVIFVQGCPHACEGCHNPQTHPFEGGTVRDTDELFEQIVQNPLLKGVTFSGGEPFCQPAPLALLAKRLHDETRLNVITYTGYTFEELLQSSNAAIHSLLGQTDILMDGRFELGKRDISLRFRGSTNQRVIDVKKSLLEGKTVLLNFDA
ncbi:anaerobic ribonucleoside-triphosphate reductase activating protein [Acetanaerobacterium elongatum]|uniref:Anaerobic ribonucleoside-triphosphate reductase-activating protein n=1 Tax=Acetanaerobacterium elongatum TaxID=258515 RepID=A0A1G9U3J4_9FIRM|nr:anaerobic ribonucleoside-triphosphate reductase activating protein [Acetanaerobacterium elongatum]SDM54539.1 anaerobic ribonucleoside-triphosphate reductase activating protein [Acetanaerobacterium elongatum]